MEYVLIFNDLYPDGLVVDSYQFDTQLRDYMEPYDSWSYIDKSMFKATIESCPELTVRISKVRPTKVAANG